MESRTPVPNVRAAVSTAVCALLAVAAHRTMSGTGIPVVAMVIGAAAVFCFARIAAALGERGLGAIGLLVGGSQIGLHLLFQAAQGSAQRGTPPMTGMAGMQVMPAIQSVPRTTPGMTIAHVLAAAVSAWWLRRGEAALFAAVGRARLILGASWRLLARWVAGTQPTGPAAPSVLAAGAGVHKPAMVRALLFTVIRRGPPVKGRSFSS